MIRNIVSIAILCALVFSIPAFADVLVLNDGREYRGVVLSQDDNAVRFEAHHHGMRMTMNVPRNSIKSLRQERRSEPASPNLPAKNADAIDAAIDESDSRPNDFNGHAADRVTAAPVEFRSSRHGYTLEVPAGWEPIPSQVVQEAVKLLQADRSTIRVNYEAAFQPTTSSGWFESAYVLVQVMPYSAFGNTRQPYEHEITKFVQALSGLDLEELVIDNATDLGRVLLGDIETAAPTVDTENRQFSWLQEQRLSNGTSVQMLAVGHFGKESLVGMYFYAPTDEWERYATARSTLLTSFEFGPEYAYDDAKATAPPQTATGNTSNTASPLPHVRNNRDTRHAVPRGLIFVFVFLLFIAGKAIFSAAAKAGSSAAIGHPNSTEDIRGRST